MTARIQKIVAAGTIAVLAIGAGAVFGGWTFALISFPLLLALVRSDYDWKQTAIAAAPGLLWLLAFIATDDRRFFFPYSLQYAVVLAALPDTRQLWERYAACAIVIGLFLLLRTLEDASLKVLAVELVVGAAVGAAVVALHGAQPQAGLVRLALATLASVLAFAGLVF